MNDTTPHRKISLRKYSRPKPPRNPPNLANEQETSRAPSPIPKNSISPTPPPSPTRPSTVESFRKIYTDVNNQSSFSGNATAIANQIPSFRLARRFKPY